MVYQRRMPREELFAAQLEVLMQNGRLATVAMQLVGILATIMLFWTFLDLTSVLLWALGFLTLLLLRSVSMNAALAERKFQTQPQDVYWQLILGAAVTGTIWAAAYIVAAQYVPVTMQYVFLLLIVMITAFSLGFSVVVREYYIVYVFTSLWPIAWWSLIHYWQQPHNLLIGLVLLAFCGLLVYVCNQTYQSYRNMISLTWEREHIAQELGDLSGSLRDRNRQLREARRQLTELANIDELTGLGNRRLVNTVLQEELNRARRSGADLSVILLDVDYFKNYNDTYGHPAGDVVLQRLADVMQQATTRAGEVVARYGGEEFILLLPGATADAAMRTAMRLQEMIAKERMVHSASPVGKYITVSQGIISVRADSEEQPADLLRRVDLMLYKAKDAGRNAIAAESD